MKLKFPQGVSNYVDAHGTVHTADDAGEIVVADSKTDLIKDMQACGFSAAEAQTAVTEEQSADSAAAEEQSADTPE